MNNTEQQAIEWLETLSKIGLTQNKAADFMNAQGEHILSLQLITEDRKAVAVLDLRSGEIDRFDAASSVMVLAKEWRTHALRIYGADRE